MTQITLIVRSLNVLDLCESVEGTIFPNASDHASLVPLAQNTTTIYFALVDNNNADQYKKLQIRTCVAISPLEGQG